MSRGKGTSRTRPGTAAGRSQAVLSVQAKPREGGASVKLCSETIAWQTMDDPLSQEDLTPFSASKPAEHEGAAERSATPFYPGLPTGTGLGKYRILERLWTTHNAVVYKARDATLDRLVTVKQMLPLLIDNPIACGLFKREAQFLARIPKDARQVVNIHELIEDQLGLFIVEEYVAGQWLESLIAKRQADPRAAIRILKTTAQGLRALHSLDLMHRGVHPANIMVGRNHNAKIANLGTAAHESDTTPPATIVPKFSAPELLQEARYDNRVDIYSLGMAIYEFCVGRIALHQFFGRQVEDPASAIGFWSRWHCDFDARLPDACELNPLVPPVLAAILRRMTAKSLNDRYVSIQEVLDAVSKCFEGGTERGEPQQFLPGSGPRRAGLQGDSFQGFPLASRTTGSLLPASTPPPPATVRGTSRLTVLTVRGPVPQTLPPSEVAVPVVVESRLAARPAAGPARRRHRGSLRPPPRPVQAETIPAPRLVEELHKQRHPRFAAWLVTSVFFFVAALAGASALWYYHLRVAAKHPLEQLVAEAMSAYDAADYETARAKLAQAVEMPGPHAKVSQHRGKAASWLRMAQARIAFSRDDFDGALRLAREAEKLGVSPSDVDALRQLCWNRKDAYRLEEEGKKALEDGRLDEAELALDEYRQKAQDAGLDPSPLETRFHESRADQRYADALRLARESLANGNFDRAFMAVAEAERSKATTETRKLRQQIADTKERADWIVRGEEAMADQNYADAALAFEKANQVEATVEVERKARTAAAMVLYEKAQAAIESGDLLAAEQHLRSSVWRYPTFSARNRLEVMSVAFEAAATVKQADEEMERGNYAEAVRLYGEAIPRLPAPADASAKVKLVKARQQVAVQRGDQAFQQGRWEAALNAYEEARSLGSNGEILKKIEAAKAKLQS